MPEAELDVSSCLERVRRGDDEAARALFNHLYPLVRKIVRAYWPRQTSQEDLIQSVFVKIFSKLDQFAGQAPLEHWVSRIAVNLCLNQLQAERVRPELRWADLGEGEARALESLTATTEELEPAHNLAARELVEKLLARLSPADRLVITLLHLEGKSVEEVRQVTGWGASLIKVRAFRARHKMKKHLETLLAGDES